MTIRPLEASEWERLRGLPSMYGWMPDPQQSIVIIAEDSREGPILAHWVATNRIQLEGFWQHPDHRDKLGRLPVRIIEAMRRELDACRVANAICWVDRPEIASYVERLGMTLLPVQTYLFEITTCPSLLRRS